MAVSKRVLAGPGGGWRHCCSSETSMHVKVKKNMTEWNPSQNVINTELLSFNYQTNSKLTYVQKRILQVVYRNTMLKDTTGKTQKSLYTENNTLQEHIQHNTKYSLWLRKWFRMTCPFVYYSTRHDVSFWYYACSNTFQRRFPSKKLPILGFQLYNKKKLLTFFFKKNQLYNIQH